MAAKARKPIIGLVCMAMPGLFMGEEMCPDKYRELYASLEKEGYVIKSSQNPCVMSREEAYKAGKELSVQDVDCLVVGLATFVADFYITEFLKGCDKPIFLWAIDREVFCIPMVCTPLVSASLYNLKKDCCVCAGEVDDDYTLSRLRIYAQAAMMKNRLQQAKIGYSGYKPVVMYSMEANAYMLDRHFGVTVIPIPVEDFYRTAEGICDAAIAEKKQEVLACGCCVDAKNEDIDLSIRYYLAAKKQVDEYHMSAYSLNCFPNLKAKICLGIALMNDDGIGAGCEGDLHASILMYLMEMLAGKAAFNGDFLKLYPEKNAIMFSHCGAGAFSLAKCGNDICLKMSAETCDGVGVFYKTHIPGKVTLVNLMNGIDELRMSCIVADSIEDSSEYEGNPLTLAFDASVDVRDVPDMLARAGTGHHWIGMQGDFSKQFELLARMCNIPFTQIYRG